MRILLVIDGMHPRHGGPPAIVAGSAIALQEIGHKTKVLTLYRPGDEPVVRDTWKSMIQAGVDLEFCDDEGLPGLFGFPSQKARFEKLVEECDVVHIHGVWCAMFLAVARICRLQGKPYFVSSHGVFDHRAMKRVKHKYIKKRFAIEAFNIRGFLGNASAVIFGSEAEAAESWLPTRKMHIEAVPNGVDASTGTDNPTAEQVKRLHAIVPALPSWKRIILCRSRIHPEKGHDMLVAAFCRIAAEFPDTGLLIAGLSQIESYEAAVRSMIAASHHRERMVLTTQLTGPSNQFVSRLCTIYATPSIAEGFSMSLVEGLANGKPMLVTRFCHMPLVESSGSGVIVDPTTDDITKGLRHLLSKSDGELARMGNAARQLFLGNYTWQKVASQLEGLYAKAIAST
jgi:glycosyltransferase involved in cell wall biosynthesis